MAVLVAIFGAAPFSMSAERDDLEHALVHALQQENRDLLTEQNTLPENGAPTEPALVFLVKRGCIRFVKNEWTLGDGCGKECHLGKLTSPYLSGDGLTCRVARQEHIRVLEYAPLASDQNGVVPTRVRYEAKLVEVADWASDPEYVAIWKSYGLNLETFTAHADMVKTPDGWIPYQ